MIGVQLQIYLRKKAEAFVNILLLVILAASFFAEYQYVLAPQLGFPPLSLHLLWEALRRRFS